MAIRNRYSATHIPTICAYIAKFATQFSTRCCRYYFDWNTSAGDQQATFTKNKNNNNKLCKISFAILKLIPCQPVHMYHPYMSAIHINIAADFQSRFYFRSQYTHLGCIHNLMQQWEDVHWKNLESKIIFCMHLCRGKLISANMKRN